MESGHIFHKLWVIESLGNDDLKTGKNLVDNQLKNVKQIQPNLEVEFEEPITKAEFFDVLVKVKNASSKGKFPMIHFECHGHEDKDGLVMASNELVEWEELRKHLIEINYSCRLNLMIVVAACNGAHLIKVCTKLDAAPFWAIVGSEVKVNAGNIRDDFGRFYESFITDLDGDKAISVLNHGKPQSDRLYKFISAAGLFSRAYLKYYKSHCIGKGKRERIESLVSEVMQKPDIQKLGVAWARKEVKNGLPAIDDQHFEKSRNSFFFIDQYPENHQRFSLSKEQIISVNKP